MTTEEKLKSLGAKILALSKEIIDVADSIEYTHWKLYFLDIAEDMEADASVIGDEAVRFFEKEKAAKELDKAN